MIIQITFFRETNAFPSRLENIRLTRTRQTGLVVVTMVMFDCDNNDDDVDGDDGVEGDNDDIDDDGHWFETNPPPSLMILISHRLMLRSSKTSTWENQLKKNEKNKSDFIKEQKSINIFMIY